MKDKNKGQFELHKKVEGLGKHQTVGEKYIEQNSKRSTAKTPTIRLPPTPTSHC